MDDFEECDLNALTALLDEDISSGIENECSLINKNGEYIATTSAADNSESATIEELGLDLSDDEKIEENFSGDVKVSEIEDELKRMQEKMNKMKEELTKRKKLNSASCHFAQLTLPQPVSTTSKRALSAKESKTVLKKIESCKSEVHSGDTDSEDEEDLRNPLESEMSDYGRQIKKRLAHSSSSLYSGSKKKIISPCLPTMKTENSMDSPYDVYSGIRIINPLVTTSFMAERMTSRKMIKMSSIYLHLRNGDIEGDWVTIGVIVSKSQTKTSQKGSQYSIWQLSDFTDCNKTVSLFLFGSAYKDLWKSTVGTVIGILNAQIMKDRDGKKIDNLLTLSVNNPQRVLIMGTSKDLGWCKGCNKYGEACKQFVNKASCEYCIFHVQKEYKKVAARRAAIQSSYSGVNPRQNLQDKVIGNSQIFYGGQLYSSSAKKKAPADKSKDMNRLKNLKIKVEEVREEPKKKLPTTLPHMSEKQINVLKQVTEKNSNLSEMLVKPTFGARNMLLHLSQEEVKENEKKDTYSIGPAELLKKTHNKQLKMNIVSNCPVDPMLGRGCSPSGDIEFDFSPLQNNITKAKAVAAIKNKGGLTPKERNHVRNKHKANNAQFKENVLKRLREDSSEETTSPKRQVNKKNLGNLDVKSEEFAMLLGKKSSHSNLLQVVEDEAVQKYYFNLEKKEQLEEKMTSIKEVPTSAVICFKCKYLAISASDFCKNNSHPLKTIKATKRFFECKNCKRRTISLDKLPRIPCSNCKSESWQRVAMRKERCEKLRSEKLSLRGDELQFYSSSSNCAYLNI